MMERKETILLVGNPNTGKTTLFNLLTKSDEKTGNWHGVTVEEKKKSFVFDKKKFLLVDLPGIYSLAPFSLEEGVAVKFLREHKDKKIVNICDINNLERNLYLSLCLIEEGFNIVLAVNLTLNKNKRKLSSEKLSKLLGVDVVFVNAKSGEGKKELLEKLGKKKVIKKQKQTEKNIEISAKEKYEKIEKILSECSQNTHYVYGKSWLDKIFLNRFFSPIIFLVIMGAIFYFTFFLVGKPVSNLLNDFLLLLGRPISKLLASTFGASSWLVFLFDEAILGGIGTILSFLPQIVLLFFFLSILEESGYISRVAFVFDDLLSKVGLSGKSIYSILLGFGCSGTAIMTTRNLENKSSRIKTAVAIPFLSCSARLPIFLTIGGVFFGENNIFVLVGLYVLGIIVAIVTSSLLNKTILKREDSGFILEFPPYRMINLKKALKVLWQNSKSFVLRVGGLLVALNVIVWVFSNFSLTFSFVRFGGESILETFARFVSPLFFPLGFSSWGLIVGLLVGVVAKEGVVSSIMLFAGDNLAKAFLMPTSEIYFSSVSGVVAYLVFCLLYVPCISTIAIMHKEIGTKWTWGAVLFQTLMAYIIAMIACLFCNLCLLFGAVKVLLFAFVMAVIALSFWVVLSRLKNKNCSTCGLCGKTHCKKRKL